MELCWSYTEQKPSLNNCEGHVKLHHGSAKVVPFGKSVFLSEQIYLAIYFWKNINFGLGISFGTDFFDKGQLSEGGIRPP